MGQTSMISIHVSDSITHWLEYVDEKYVGEIIVYKPTEWVWDLKRLIASCSSASPS